MQYYLLCLFGNCLMFAKCIRQNFLISILPPDLLICLEGKTLTDQHSESAFYPHRSANQHFTSARRSLVSARTPYLFTAIAHVSSPNTKSVILNRIKF